MTQKWHYRRTFKRVRPWLMATAIAVSLAVWGAYPQGFGSTPLLAQSLRAEQSAAIIYQKLTYLPQENQYRRQDTGEIDPEHTLISRFIRYHQDLQKRPVIYALDWKITLADYLGLNEPIVPERYPGSATLQENPAEKDLELISRLNRRQRQELVDLLVSLYKTNAGPSPQPAAESTSQPTTTDKPAVPSLSRPGDAQLLKRWQK